MFSQKNILFVTTFTLFCIATTSIIFLFSQTKLGNIKLEKINIIDPTYGISLNIDEQDPNYRNIKDYFSNNSTAKYDIVTPDKSVVSIGYSRLKNSVKLTSEPLVAIVSRQIYLDDIKFDQIPALTNQMEIDGYTFNKIVISEKYSSELKETFPNQNLDQLGILPDNESVIDLVAEDKNALGFVPISQLNLSVHSLLINGFSPFDQPELYPLKINIYLSTDNQKIKEQLIGELKNNISTPKTTNLLVVGDIMMGRFVGVKINRSGDPAHSFEFVQEYLSKPDITIAQLEAPISDGTALTGEGMILVAQPETVEGLTKSGIDLVFLSSNHFGDALRDGMESNFQILEKNDIQYVGAGRDENKAFSPKFIDKNGTKYGFISFVSIMPDSYGASGDIAGTAWIDLNSESDLSRVQTIISDTKKDCDLLFVNFHWGTEYTPDPTLQQIQFAHAAIDSGADLIIGTHPHVVQADEIYKGKYIIYSLGNFIMDQMWSQETTEGVLLPIQIYNKKIINIDLVPTQILDYSQVKILNKNEGKGILDRIFFAEEKINKKSGY
ncbi:MAG: CapA family protein [Patescibacteria group bacterium]